MTQKQKPDLFFVKEIALQAGKILRKMHRTQLEVQHKSKADLVTAADKASELFIINEIKKFFPNHSINAEESGLHGGDSEHQWFVDPLDGTLNYAHGMSFFSVSIAYAFNGKLELGVVYDPLLNELFTSQRGDGAFLNGRKLEVSNTNRLIDALLVTGFRHHLLDTNLANFDNFMRFSRLTQGVRRLGSAALDLAYVAAGRLDGFWEVSVSQWDVAAGALLVQEAGGIVTKMYGEPDFMSNPVSILAANPTMHKDMLDILLSERENQTHH
jgi:myo-inositol-1(or 4)-monophosphatase